MMESGSEGENQEFGVEKQGKPKWQMKTPFQLGTLERAYAGLFQIATVLEDMYPSEAAMLELSEKLNLTDRQLQMWFCHRRLKDKKGGTPSTPGKKESSPMSSKEAKNMASQQYAGSPWQQESPQVIF